MSRQSNLLDLVTLNFSLSPYLSLSLSVIHLGRCVKSLNSEHGILIIIEFCHSVLYSMAVSSTLMFSHPHSECLNMSSVVAFIPLFTILIVTVMLRQFQYTLSFFNKWHFTWRLESYCFLIILLLLQIYETQCILILKLFHYAWWRFHSKQSVSVLCSVSFSFCCKMCFSHWNI